jgi:Protein of unknown function (DUF1003)
VPALPVEVRNGEVWVKATFGHTDPAMHWRQRLSDGLGHDIGLIAKAVQGQLAAGVPKADVVRQAALFGAHRDGWGVGLTILTALAEEEAELHAAHYREAGALKKTVSGAISAVARPGTLIVITVAIAGWAALNFALPAFGRAAPDPLPFPLLAAAVSTLALYLAAMILIAQRHDDQLATRRDQLTLELAILSEQNRRKSLRCWKNFAATTLTRATTAT